jgi:hypothetical protein
MGKNKSEHSYLANLKKNWVEYLSVKNSWTVLLITLILIISTLGFFTHFINSIESRNGVELNDPILKLFNPIDLSGFIFGIIYISIMAGLISLLGNPREFVFALQVYTLIVVVRIITLYLTPLNAPENMIPLVDPLVKNLGTGQMLTKDLFFSGHTATMFFLFLVSPSRKMKMLYFFGFIIIAVAVLLQHVHYTIDVIAAPFFTYTSFRIILLLRKNFNFS